MVNGGFVQGATDHVAVQVVYDERAELDGLDGIDVMPITRELRAKDPLALNLMHITVDGEPIDDPGRSSADIQRCTDVALESADIRFEFDDLDAGPRLSVTSQTGAVAVPASPLGASGAAGVVGPPGAVTTATGVGVDFQMYSNYGHFIERSEVRIFERGQSSKAE